jgi:hypothetical protein
LCEAKNKKNEHKTTELIMKKIIGHIAFIILLDIIFCVGAFAQRIITYGPKTSDTRLEIFYKADRYGYYDWGGSMNCCPCNIGRIYNPGYFEYPDSAMALLYEWNLPMNDIPFGSIIKYAKIEFQYSIPSGSGSELDPVFYKIPRHVTNDDITGFWNVIDDTSKIIGETTGSYGEISVTFDSTSKFVDSLQTCLKDSLQNNYFSMGIWTYF